MTAQQQAARETRRRVVESGRIMFQVRERKLPQTLCGCVGVITRAVSKLAYDKYAHLDGFQLEPLSESLKSGAIVNTFYSVRPNVWADLVHQVYVRKNLHIPLFNRGTV